MATEGFIGVAIPVDIKMRSAIQANHTIQFFGKPDEYTLSPSSMTFTPANFNTPQVLTVVGLRPGSIPIPYEITSPYTQRKKRSSIEVFCEPLERATLVGGPYQSAVDSSGFPTNLTAPQIVPTYYVQIPTQTVGYQLKAKRTSASGSHGNSGAIYIDGVFSSNKSIPSTLNATSTIFTVGPGDLGKDIRWVIGGTPVCFEDPTVQAASPVIVPTTFELIDNFTGPDTVIQSGSTKVVNFVVHRTQNTLPGHINFNDTVNGTTTPPVTISNSGMTPLSNVDSDGGAITAGAPFNGPGGPFFISGNISPNGINSLGFSITAHRAISPGGYGYGYGSIGYGSLLLKYKGVSVTTPSGSIQYEAILTYV